MKSADQLHADAMALNSNGDTVGCVKLLQEALLLNPSYAEAWNNRGSMLLKLGHPFDAVMNYDKAIACKPDAAEFYNNRGAAFIDLGMLDEAMTNYDCALAIKPDLAESLLNKGNICMKKRETETAIMHYRSAIDVQPDYADAHLGLSFALLETGQYDEGWLEYEWRWQCGQLPPRGLNYRRWNGEHSNSKTDALLVYAEQGFGDTLQFCRFAPLIKEKWGGKVYLEVRQPLVRLMRTLKGTDEVYALGERLPPNITCMLPMMSAPLIIGSEIPRQVPYLKADKHRAGLWHKELARLPAGLKVGLCWAGMARPLQPIANSIDQRRSTTLANFAPLAIPGVSFVSLQLGPPSEQAKYPPAGMTILDGTSDIDDFHDTAALIDCLDLVISVDTAVVHLAAALGKPTWLLSRYDNCWRWLRERRDSPWYPSLRQFRQPSQGDWASMIAEVSQELKQFVRQKVAA